MYELNAEDGLIYNKCRRVNSKQAVNTDSHGMITFPMNNIKYICTVQFK